MKRVFGLYEAVFDVVYLALTLVIGVWLIATAESGSLRLLAGIMALILGGGDAFHLLPRIMVIHTQKEEAFRTSLGRGKQITSITMTVFYLLLWNIGVRYYFLENTGMWTCLIYSLAIIRILLCLAPQNCWLDRYPPQMFAILRNIPFFLIGIMTVCLYFANRGQELGLVWMWLAVLLSFLFYFPVVLWANRYPAVGMLMLPKTCAYMWMLVMCLKL